MSLRSPRSLLALTTYSPAKNCLGSFSPSFLIPRQAEDFDNGGEGVAYHDNSTYDEGRSNYREVRESTIGRTACDAHPVNNLLVQLVRHVIRTPTVGGTCSIAYKCAAFRTEKSLVVLVFLSGDKTKVSLKQRPTNINRKLDT